ncbi:MAG: hypothetical protein KF748_00255 [Xanthobacteraceae bacterium]|nr:hypothetical protein [Xanthobacteraceae bacterium]
MASSRFNSAKKLYRIAIMIIFYNILEKISNAKSARKFFGRIADISGESGSVPGAEQAAAADVAARRKVL